MAIKNCSSKVLGFFFVSFACDEAYSCSSQSQVSSVCLSDLCVPVVVRDSIKSCTFLNNQLRCVIMVVVCFYYCLLGSCKNPDSHLLNACIIYGTKVQH